MLSPKYDWTELHKIASACYQLGRGGGGGGHGYLYSVCTAKSKSSKNAPEGGWRRPQREQRVYIDRTVELIHEHQIRQDGGLGSLSLCLSVSI